MAGKQYMKKVNLAYEMLGDSILRAQYDNTDQFVQQRKIFRFDSHGTEMWLVKKSPWTEWPEGISFPRWRSSPPGAWPLEREKTHETSPELHPAPEAPIPKFSSTPERNAPERLSQDATRDREREGDTTHRLSQPEEKHHGREERNLEPERPPYKLHDLRRPISHPRRKHARKDSQQQLRQGNHAAPSLHQFERPWPWIKRLPQKRKLVEKVFEDECEDAREVFWDVFFWQEHPEYLTGPTAKRRKTIFAPEDQTAPVPVGNGQESKDEGGHQAPWEERSAE